ncbi:MAG: HAD family hydrolase [Gammaproteobacteria bacterium]|nr:MAG: HAD family hydrolase [Gammaproteobacteria bacterium]
MSELKAILFDVDGTLAETERYGHLVATNQGFKTCGLDWQWSEELYGKLLKVTGSFERITHFVNTYHPDWKHVSNNLNELITEIVRQKNINFKRIVENGQIPLRPGVERLLREIHDSDLRMAIVTTTSPQNVEALLVNNIGGDVLDWFDVIAAGDIVPKKKPAPDIYNLTLNEMNLSPQECLAIEDSENGVKSATTAGVPVMVTLSEYSEGHDLDDAILIVDGLGDETHTPSVIKGSLNGNRFINVDLMRRLVLK